MMTLANMQLMRKKVGFLQKSKSTPNITNITNSCFSHIFFFSSISDILSSNELQLVVQRMTTSGTTIDPH